MIHYRFLQPLDLLSLRGNKLFGDPGSYGETLMPPWPSVAAGALRSRILAEDNMIEPAAFARGEHPHPVLGTPGHPGPFTLTHFHLAQRLPDGHLSAIHPLPADLVLTRSEDRNSNPHLHVERLTPHALPPDILASRQLPCIPVLPERQRSKPAAGFWLTQDGWVDYLAGRTPSPGQLLPTERLWQHEARIGVGLDPERGSAADQKLFTTQAVTLSPDIGFLVGVSGGEPPESGLLRFGGDGRGVAIQPTDYLPPEPDFEALAAARRCRIVLTSPGIFPSGWLPAGSDTSARWQLDGLTANLVCAAVPRAGIVSGWDLAHWQPKPARRAAATGSVYWLEDLEASPQALRNFMNSGLWDSAGKESPRRAEGFNRFTLAAY